MRVDIELCSFMEFNPKFSRVETCSISIMKYYKSDVIDYNLRRNENIINNDKKS